MIRWLYESNVPAAEYLKAIEEENEQRAESRQREISDMHYAYASDHYQFWRDVAEQDPMAGHRHWSAPVEIDLVNRPEGSATK